MDRGKTHLLRAVSFAIQDVGNREMRAIKKEFKSDYPLWWCLSPETQQSLVNFQKQKYGYNLNPPLPPGAALESTEEIGKIMSKPPEMTEHIKA